MMTFMEVKGQQRSNVVNYTIWLPNFVRRTSDAVEDDNDLYEGQRSMEVECNKLCHMATKRGQKNRWCKFKMMMKFIEVKGQQRLNTVNYALWLQNLVRRIVDASLRW